MCVCEVCTHISLLDLLVRLLFVILKIHDGFLSQFQVTLKLSLGSFKVHTELLLLLQRTFKLYVKRRQCKNIDIIVGQLF